MRCKFSKTERILLRALKKASGRLKKPPCQRTDLVQILPDHPHCPKALLPVLLGPSLANAAVGRCLFGMATFAAINIACFCCAGASGRREMCGVISAALVGGSGRRSS